MCGCGWQLTSSVCLCGQARRSTKHIGLQTETCSPRGGGKQEVESLHTTQEEEAKQKETKLNPKRTLRSGRYMQAAGEETVEKKNTERRMESE